MICLSLPCIPPLKNKVRRARLSKSGKIYMVGGQDVEKFLLVVRAAVNRARAESPIVELAPKARIKIEVWFTFTSRRFDADGPYYCLQDCLAQVLGFNDLAVEEIVIHKAVKREVYYTYVEVSEIEKEGSN